MQDLVGIVRTESEMQQALSVIAALDGRAENVGITGHRQYNNGWHTAIDLANLLLVSEAITRAALLRKESRGAQFREDYLTKILNGASTTSSSSAGRMAKCWWRSARSRLCLMSCKL
jgi:succinate dehydrogenase/fumarate reductase flavoprotein subunit